jgi:flagellar hook-basal body complex protein FliE
VIDPLGAIGGGAAMADLVIRPNQPAATDFGTLLGSAVQHLNESLQSADRTLRGLAAGEDIPVHQAMLTLEQARLELQFAVEVRNRLLEAYQQITQMQV